MKKEEIFEEIISKNFKALRDMAFEIEYEFLEHSVLDSDATEIYASFLSDDRFFNARNSEYFVLALGHDVDKVKDIEEMLDLIEQNCVRYERKDFIYAIGDFIARKINPLRALTLLEHISNIDASSAKAISNFGLGILSNEDRFPKDVVEKAKKIIADC